MLGVALAASLMAAGPAAAQQSGQLRMTIHTHSNDDPVWTGLQFPTDRLSYAVTPGETFSYSSRTCEGRAPFNDVGLNFTPDYPGVDDDADSAAKVRYRIQGTVIASAGDRGAVQGTITVVLCSGDVATSNVIVADFWAQYIRISNNALQVFGGFQISPTQSTGTFRDMQGGGRLEGRFVCLAHQGNPAAPSCAQLGHFTDFVGHSGDPTLGPGVLQPGLVGSYVDPTVTTGGSSA